MPATDRQEILTDEGMKGRRLPVGAEVVAGGVHFRVWAPRRRHVDVVFGDRSLPLVQLSVEKDGYFSGVAAGARVGTLYRFRVDQDRTLLPDPASRFQPEGPHGPSEVIDPRAFAWHDQHWKGNGPAGQVLYEMHIGTFTGPGTWEAAAAELPSLGELGITCIELMPVADFSGTFGWGYDGVNLFAPTRLYGRPDDFRRFVDTAHTAGIGVILDVVYNHIGPDGNYLPEFAPDYFSEKYKTDWGRAINFDGPNSKPVRDFYLANARHWIEEYHLDGFRYDATQNIYDSSGDHILAAITRHARETAGRRRTIYIAENEPQHTEVVRACGAGGLGMDALWNDDFHHAAMVVLSGRNEAYYTDYLGKPQEFISAAKWGYLYQGQRYTWQQKRRGTPGLDLPPTAFIHFIQNHDQIANSARGLRAHQIASPAQYRAMTALFLLMPQTPMLFQGQEYASSSPFYYFADQSSELGQQICAGRATELSQFPSIATSEMQAALIDPCNRQTFGQSKLDLRERDRPPHARMYAMHKDLLRLRREEPALSRVQKRGDMDGAVLGTDAFVLRFFCDRGADRLLIVNLGTDLTLCPAPEPLLAPPSRARWVIQWSSEDPRYGGCGTPSLDTEQEGWLLPGRCTVLLKPQSVKEAESKTRIKKSGVAKRQPTLAREPLPLRDMLNDITSEADNSGTNAGFAK